LIKGWLSAWYALPEQLLLFTGVVNLIYASYSIPLAARVNRPLSWILFLVAANLAWAVVCFSLAFMHWPTASVFGMAHLIAEGLYVGGLACLEYRWREDLR
jgi:hypothetical protein